MSEENEPDVNPNLEQESNPGSESGSNLAGDSHSESEPQSISDFESSFNRDTRDGISENLDEVDDTKFDTSGFNRSDWIGPYKLLQPIGEGGMGTVWMAEQEEPVRRRVALKVIRGDMGSKESIARFEAERQALAMMDHQNISRVFDAGTTPKGNPYFVMELVKGIPITKYCDRNKLSIRERLELIVPVCRAVQHAHQKGIIHRDLKPSNVLVTLYDGHPVPKVIDFGLAKALDHQHQLTDKTMFTEFGKVVGTLQYMSPEQAEMNALDVDTRTDIYSLGVMVYELLTGTTPLEKHTLHSNAFLKVLEMIREGEPQSPSTRLSSCGKEITGVSEHRKISPARLQQLLKGELDWIVMKALEKDRTRRYETANGLAADIQRYLDDEPVTARPQSSTYRLQKFFRKNKGFVATIAAIGVLLMAGVAGTSIFAIKAESARHAAVLEKQRADEKTVEAIQEKNRADQKSKEAAAAAGLAEIARLEAEASAKRAADVLQVVTDSFETANPFSGADADVSAKDVLLNAQKILKESELDNEGKAILLRKLTHVFVALGELDSGVSTAEEELRVLKQIDPKHPSIREAMYRLGRAKRQSGLFDDAIAIFRNSLKEMDQHNVDANDEFRLHTMMNLGLALTQSGRNDESIPILQETLARRMESLGEGNQATIDSMGGLAMVLSKAGRNEESIKLFAKAAPIAELHLGFDHPTTLAIRASLATAYHRMGEFDEALIRYEALYKLREKKFGAAHPVCLGTKNNIALIHVTQKRYAKGLQVYQETLDTQLESMGEGHPQTLILRANIVGALNEARLHIEDAIAKGDFFEAEKLLNVSKSFEEHLTNRLKMQIRSDLFLVNMAKENYDEALEAAGEWQELLGLEFENVNLLSAQPQLAKSESLLGMKNYSEARAAVDKVLTLNQLEPALELRAKIVLAVCDAYDGPENTDENQVASLFNEFNKLVVNDDHQFDWHRKFFCQRVIEVFKLAANDKAHDKWKSTLQEISNEIQKKTEGRMTAGEATEINDDVIRIASLRPHKDTPVLTEIQLKKMRRVCETFPKGMFLLTLSLAEFRKENYAEAMDSAKRAMPKLRYEINQPSDYPGCNAIIAASLLELGDKEMSKEFQNKMEIGMKLEKFTKDAACMELVTELTELMAASE